MLSSVCGYMQILGSCFSVSNPTGRGEYFFFSSNANVFLNECFLQYIYVID